MGLSEECAVFGVSLATDEAAGIIYNGLLALQHRGQEGAGIAVVTENRIYCHKDMGLVSEVFSGDVLESLPRAKVAVGHARYSTMGSHSKKNAGPFVTEYLTGRIATAHNGNVTNAWALRDGLRDMGLQFTATSDIMKQKAYLILANGTVMQGESFGATGNVVGEVVFTTGMTGYLETLTDQSYYGQIVLQTFPLIGNYGVIPEDFESDRIALTGYIVKDLCTMPSNFRSEGDLGTFLKERGVIGISGIDTRALVKQVREQGVMNGKITMTPPTEKDLAEVGTFYIKDAVANVTCKTITKQGSGSRKVALIDYGAKRGIEQALLARDCEVWTFPSTAKAEEILEMEPDGIMLSNGPGDPAEPANTALVETLRVLKERDVTIFGICLGHQLLALASGYRTEKLKFGHRGANQPVKELSTGRVYVTSQNHGYAVVSEDSSFVSVNDGSCEGLDYGRSFSVQFHPEACGGPLDTRFLFDRFIERMG